MSKSYLAVGCVAAVVLALSNSASAANWEVILDSATIPPGVALEDVEADIQQVLRQWEHNSNGRANFRWGGSVAGASCQSGRTLIKFGSLTNACAYNNPWTLGLSACQEITIATTVNGGAGPRPRQHPSVLGVGSRCVDLQGTLHHELAHGYHNVPNAHSPDSVRSPCSASLCVQDSHVRHQWNTDMTSFDPVWYPPRTLGLAHASFSPSTLGDSGEQLTSSPTFRFAAAALSSGSIVHGEEYAWSYSLESDTSGAVNSGNGLST